MPLKKNSTLSEVDELVMEVAALRSEIRDMHEKVNRIDRAFRMGRIFRWLRFLFIAALFLGLAKLVNDYLPTVTHWYQTTQAQIEHLKTLGK